jgi:hypothetical protein
MAGLSAVRGLGLFMILLYVCSVIISYKLGALVKQ